MTTPTDFQRWHAEAMSLADRYADLMDSSDADPFGNFEVVTARAALSAHLLAVPMGERVGYFQTDSMGQTYQVGAEFAGDSDVFPLFTKPEGMA
jgi:hypothetical protein